MLFKHLKEQMLLPSDEIIINKTVTFRDKECIILGMTSQNEENKLWIIIHDENSERNSYLCEDDCYFNEELECEKTVLTNREQMEENLSRDAFHLHIKDIEIQGQKITFDSSTGTSLQDNSYDLCMALQHFVENGLSTDSFDEFSTNDLMLYTYKQQDDEKFPKIDLSKPLDIKMQIAEDYKEILQKKAYDCKIWRQYQ